MGKKFFFLLFLLLLYCSCSISCCCCHKIFQAGCISFIVLPPCRGKTKKKRGKWQRNVAQQTADGNRTLCTRRRASKKDEDEDVFIGFVTWGGHDFKRRLWAEANFHWINWLHFLFSFSFRSVCVLYVACNKVIWQFSFSLRINCIFMLASPIFARCMPHLSAVAASRLFFFAIHLHLHLLFLLLLLFVVVAGVLRTGAHRHVATKMLHHNLRLPRWVSYASFEMRMQRFHQR